MRDSLSKYLYEHVFKEVIFLMNADNVYDSTQLDVKILDIAGFGKMLKLKYIWYIVLKLTSFFIHIPEYFQKGNHFEQLCINFINEKVQQTFVVLMLKSEQEWYSRECLEVPRIEFFDNHMILGEQ